MVDRRGFLFTFCLILTVLFFAGNVWASNRAVRDTNVADAFNSRINRGHKLFSLDSPGGSSNGGGNDFIPIFESAPSGEASALSSNGNGGSSNSSIPLNLNLYLNLLGMSIGGQNISQGNALDSNQLALLAQSANADLIALNIATIIQNNFRSGSILMFPRLSTWWSQIAWRSLWMSTWKLLRLTSVPSTSK